MFYFSEYYAYHEMDCHFYRKPPDSRDALTPHEGRQQELVYIPWRIDNIKEPIGHTFTRYEKKDNPLLALEDNFVLRFPLFFTLKELEQLKTIQISPANLMK